jgi:D-glycero-D-manno-heptose 1,7-bisphosphate phosphatase
MLNSPHRIAIRPYPAPANPATPDGEWGGIPRSRLASGEAAATVLLVPRSDPGTVNAEALCAWHRAHGGGVTLLVDRSGWTGVAAVDQILLAGFEGDRKECTVQRLRGLARPKTISFPGTPLIRAALLDRDGTIIEERDYLADPDGVALLPGAATGLRMLAEHGCRLAVVTNQSGVASGRLTQAQLDLVHRRLQDRLGARGVTLDGLYACVHASAAGCACRKPEPGLAHQAAADLGIPLDRAVVAGDKPADLALACRLGIPAFLVTTGHGSATLRDPSAGPDYVIDGLDELARICCHAGGLAVPAELPAG